MRKSTRFIVICIAVFFLLSIIGGCKYAQTITVDKDQIGKTIKTQWGNFKFSDSQVKKIKKMKDVSKLKSKKDIKKNTFTCKKKIKGNTIGIAVSYLGGGKYQLVMGGGSF